MNWLTSILGFFTGNTGGKIADIADEAVFTSQEKAAVDTKQTVDVLANTSIDIFNRLVRPVVTFWLIGGLSGCWKLPDTTQVDPVWFQIFMIVITFWFGGRVLLKDLPQAVGAILKMRKG